MAGEKKNTKADLFIEEMIRCRGIEFARIGMAVEVDGDMATIVGMNSNANLNVQYTNQLKHGKRVHNCHPTWRTKYFGADGEVIAQFDDSKCVFRPGQAAA